MSVPGSQGTKERVSRCSSKRHLSTLASNRPKYDSLLGPAATRGPGQSGLCVGDRPRLWQPLASRPWADVQKCDDAHFKNTELECRFLPSALRSERGGFGGDIGGLTEFTCRVEGLSRNVHLPYNNWSTFPHPVKRCTLVLAQLLFMMR